MALAATSALVVSIGTSWVVAGMRTSRKCGSNSSGIGGSVTTWDVAVEAARAGGLSMDIVDMTVVMNVNPDRKLPYHHLHRGCGPESD